MDDLLRINEVGLPNGLQDQTIAVACADKLRLVVALVDAGIQSIEATNFVSSKAVPQMADADKLYSLLPRTDEVGILGVSAQWVRP